MENKEKILEKLKQTLSYVNTHSSFYKAKFKNDHFDPSEFKSIDDLQKISTTTKDDVQKSNKDFFCISDQNIVDYSSTSGTLGNPVVFPLSEKDLERLALNESLSLGLTGVTAKTRILLTTTIDKQFMAGMAYFLGARKCGASVIRSGPGLPMLQWSLIEEYKPDYLIAVPSFVVKLQEYARKHKIDYQNSSIKKILCIGEPIRDEDFNYSALGKKITQDWDVQLYSTYASTEMSTAFTECTAGKGGHVPEDLIYVEVLDDNNIPVALGVPGEITVTSLGVEAMPVVRYKTGDIATLYEGVCNCGRLSARIGPILGRKQQMIKIKGTTIFPQAIYEVMNRQDFLKDFYVKVENDEFMLDHLSVILSTDREQHWVREKLKEEFRASVRVVPDIVFESEEAVKSVKNQLTHRKAIIFLDNRNKS